MGVFLGPQAFNCHGSAVLDIPTDTLPICGLSTARQVLNVDYKLSAILKAPKPAPIPGLSLV